MKILKDIFFAVPVLVLISCYADWISLVIDSYVVAGVLAAWTTAGIVYFVFNFVHMGIKDEK